MESFRVNATIVEVVDLFSYQVKIKFNTAVLSVVNIEEGPFMKDNTPGSTFFSTDINEFAGYAVASCLILGAPSGVSGSGDLFTVTFTVEAPGESILEIVTGTDADTVLVDSTVTNISYTTSDGSFNTMVPVAYFEFSPRSYGRPLVGENVTFDASASYDPDGGSILSYTWDFNDTTIATVNDPIIKHAFSEASGYARGALTPYNVTLTVTDNDNKDSTFFIRTTAEGVNVKFHDITVVEVTTPEEIFRREVASINVTVRNNGSHQDACNITGYVGSQPIGTERVGSVEPGENSTVSFDWHTYINSSFIHSFASSTEGTWIYPLNASASDDLYTYSNTNNTYQDYTFEGKFFPAGWTGTSKMEVGIEVRTDTDGDDMINITAYDGSWGESHIYDIAENTTDRFFWIDVTDNLAWEPYNLNSTKVRIQYLQRGLEATPIYVDLLQVRISPLNPIDVPEGSYAVMASAYLVDPILDYKFRPGEEADTTDNTLFGDPLIITLVPKHDIAVTNVTVSPTEVVVGRTATVNVEIQNNGNVEEIFDVILEANSTVVDEQTNVRLLAGGTRTLRFTWYETTNSTDEGSYNITVYIPPVVDELPANQTNNVFGLTATMRLLPTPFFTFSPSQPTLLEEVTFDASASYAPGVPGGTIDGYVWDFDDDTPLVSTTNPVVTHAFIRPGSYSVKLTVIDDEDLNYTELKTVAVQKFDSTITLAVSSATVPLSLDTIISGSISPLRADVMVTVNYTRIDEGNWLPLENVTTDESGQYSYSWTPQVDGDYQIRTFWLGDATTFAAESPVLDVTVVIQDIAIDEVVPSKFKLILGDSLTIDVTATNIGTATATFDITLYYNNTALETKTVNDLAAGASETVSFIWDTQDAAEGVYKIDVATEPLPGETSTDDNSRTSNIVILQEQETPLDIYFYTTIGLGIVIAAMAVFMIMKLRSTAK
jgi:hypothetical protein